MRNSDAPDVKQVIRTRERTPYLVSPARVPLLIALLALATAGAIILSVSIGVIDIPAGEVLRVMADRLGIDQTGIDPLTAQVIWDFRIPRALLALVVGGGLGVAGATIQAVVRSPLGDPYLIGLMSGASLGAVAVIVLVGTSSSLYGNQTAPLLSISSAAFVGSLGAFALALILGRQSGRFPPARLIMAGVAVGYLLSAMTFYLQTLATPDQLRQAIFWSLGSVAGAEWSDLALPSLAVVVCTLWLTAQGRKLNALVSGEETARSLGVDVTRFQIEMMVIASILTAAAVAVAGGIIFIGLMIPHIVRLIVGADHRRVLPVTVLLGGAFLVLVDLVARTVLEPIELPLGVITAAVGAPFFMWLLRARGKSGAQ